MAQTWRRYTIIVDAVTEEQVVKAERIMHDAQSLLRANGLRPILSNEPTSGHRRSIDHGRGVERE